jgi:hypothetical protein
MSWGCKPAVMLLAILICTVKIFAQNTTSPYSILGIGDIETKDFGRYFASGNAATARRDAMSYNFSNPASLTALPFKTMNMDIAFRGRVINFNSPYDNETSATSKDFVLKRISLAFKVSEKTAFAAGLRPFSTVNYKYYGSSSIDDGNATVYKSTDGEGGINQVYVSYAKQLSKRWDAGITASWLFGNSTRNNTYYSSEADLNITGKFQQFYYGGAVTAGLQYHSEKSKKLRHQVGVTGSFYQSLKGEYTGSYSDATAVLSTEIKDNTFKMPVQFNAGYAATLKNTYTLSVEGQYAKWDYQKLNYTNSFVDNTYKFGIGLEYAPRMKKSNIEKYYLAAGFNYERNYMVINKNYMHDISVSFGGGYNASRIIYLHAGIETGKKGDTNAGQYKENYVQFVVGFTLKDIWIGAKKFGRYN